MNKSKDTQLAHLKLEKIEEDKYKIGDLKQFTTDLFLLYPKKQPMIPLESVEISRDEG